MGNTVNVFNTTGLSNFKINLRLVESILESKLKKWGNPTLKFYFYKDGNYVGCGLGLTENPILTVEDNAEYSPKVENLVVLPAKEMVYTQQIKKLLKDVK